MDKPRCDVIIERDPKNPLITNAFINGKLIPRMINMELREPVGKSKAMIFEVFPTSINGIDCA